ncbi:hypothetical protein ACIBCT_28745 [Streptosporangium sp. NPDC050855]|uniref:hypothetical protein n=1 Tax=Streptosporangium sp. NPDC050855 TaxID=3366194 RepID=UPI0037A0A391
MLVWQLITVGAFVVAVGSWAVYTLTERRRSAWVRRHKPGSCFYLDEDYAMDLYLQEDKYPDLQRSVQETTRRGFGGKVKGNFSRVSTEMTAEDQREQLIKSIKDEGPITVIGRIARALDDANDIVYVDLFNCTITPSAGLDHALQRTHGKRAKRVDAARLQELDPFTFVSVMGRFRVTATSETTTTFSAPYGDPAEFSDDLPRVTVTCETAQLRRSVPDDPFPARCLGKIRHWDPGTRQLVISPVLTIFQ